jgi:UDP-glucose:(heptosyl)LPS alpha-1,3-glucosyltransferase
MNVAIAYEDLRPERGGCETYIRDLAHRFVADGHQVQLFVGAIDAAAFPATAIIHRVPRAGGPRWLRPWRFGARCAAAMQQVPHDVSLGFGRTLGQDVVFLQGGWHAASAAMNLAKHRGWLARTVARTLRLVDPAYWSHRWLERRLIADPRTHFIVPSRMVQRHGQLHHGLPAERVRVVHNAIDPERFQAYDRLRLRVQERERLGIDPGAVVALFVGHNYRLKGLEPLLRAVALLPAESNLHLVACGGADTWAFQRRVDAWGIGDRVHLLGYVPEIRGLFFAADFLVHPTFYDPCALVTLEALACGLPVVTSQFNGASELLPPALQANLLDDPHDTFVLGHRLSMMCDPRRRAEQARAARQAAQAWTFDDHYRGVLEILQEAAARRRAA